MKRLNVVLAALAILFITSSTGGATLVADGGFESGNFDSWTHVGDTSYDYISSPDFNPEYIHSGNHGAVLGPLAQTSLYQDLVTIPGQTYSISFWLKNDNWNSTPVNNFTAYWGNTSNTLFSGQDLIDSSFTQYTYLREASSTTTRFGFSYANRPGYFVLDDISVSSVSPVPIPGSLILFGSGLMGLVGIARNRLKR